MNDQLKVRERSVHLLPGIFRYCILITVMFCLQIKAKGQDKQNEQLIAASQAEASVVYFDFPKAADLSVTGSSFNNNTECITRNGLPNFVRKANNGKTVKVAYMGGSITRSDNMYRLQSAAYIQALFPQTTFMGINAGISGSDADLGACRFEDQVMQYQPDLLFIEFAVNGGFPQGIEGIIRQAKKADPELDICLIYTVNSAQLTSMSKGSIPERILSLDSIAAHYGIPSIHLAQEAASMLASGNLVAKGNPNDYPDKKVFSQDGVHPLPYGGDLYAAAIARSFKKIKTLKSTPVRKLPDPLLSDNWEDAKMLPPHMAAKFSKGWTKSDPDSIAFSRYKEWFPYLMQAEAPGETFTIRFKGSMFGFFDIGGPESGNLDLLVDGRPVKLKRLATNRFQLVAGEGDGVNRFNVFCNNRHRGQFICIELEEGSHSVTFRISETMPDKREILGANQLEDITANPEKYQHSVINLGKILIRGELIHP